MDKQTFIDALCEDRPNCSRSSALTHYSTIRRILRLLGKSDKKVPKSGKWINVDKFLRAIQGFTKVVQRNLTTSFLVFAQLVKATKAIKNKISEYMYSVVKDIRKDQATNKHKLNDKQKSQWITDEHKKSLLAKGYE